jgi:hypothetical protein
VGWRISGRLCDIGQILVDVFFATSIIGLGFIFLTFFWKMSCRYEVAVRFGGSGYNQGQVAGC